MSRYIGLDAPASSCTLAALSPSGKRWGSVWGAEHRRDLRSLVHESHRIVYRVRADEVAILSVRHTRRQAEESPEEG